MRGYGRNSPLQRMWAVPQKGPKCCAQSGESFKTVAAKVLTAFTTGATAKDCGLPKSTELGNRHRLSFPLIGTHTPDFTKTAKAFASQECLRTKCKVCKWLIPECIQHR